MVPPLFWWVVAWCLGIALAAHLSLSFSTWCLLAAAPLPLVIWQWRARPAPTDALERITTPPPWYDRSILLGIALTACALGAARHVAAQPDFTLASLATYNDGGDSVTVDAIVTGYPQQEGDRQRLRLRAESLVLPGGSRRSVSGDAIVTLPRYPVYRYGDRLRVVGLLETPPVLDGFDYRAYLARKGIHSQVRRAYADLVARDQGSVVYHVLYGVRARAQQVIGRILPEPHAALMSGILLGIESGIPEEVMEQFNATGTTHIIVISGFNISILAGIFLAIGTHLIGSEQRATYGAIGAVIAYTLLVGADAAVTRAALMGIAYLVAVRVGRQTAALSSLALAAFGMTAHNPGTLHDVGFQLSALATLSLILFVPGMTRWTESRLSFLGDHRGVVMNLLNEALIVTFAAQLMTTPLVVSVFGRLSVVSLLTNLLILPVQAWVMLGGGAATIVGLLSEPLGRLLAWIPWAGLTWTFEMVEWTARLPYASVEVTGFDGRWLAGYYTALLGGWAMLQNDEWRKRASDLVRTRRAQVQTAGIAALAVVTVIPWLLVYFGPDGRLHLTVFDVGQGDAIFIETPGGRQVLIDGGEDPQLVLSRLGDAMPPWDRSIDLIVVSHPDGDHLGGLPDVLERYEVARILDPEIPTDSALGDAWERAATNEGASLVRAQRGQQFRIGDVHLDVLWPPATHLDKAGSDDNNNSVVLRLRYGEFCALLTGDIEAPAEQELVSSGNVSRCSVLKVGHHGSDTSTTPAFLDAVAPRVALISAGVDNRFGHPSPEVVERLQDAGVRIFRTDTHGSIELITDGRQTWVRTSR